MTYRIIYAPSFLNDVDRYLAYLIGEKVAIATIEQWFTKLYDQVDGLRQWPERFPVDPVQTQATGQETRKMNIGDYLVFYQIDEVAHQVNIVAFMHGAKRKEA